MNGDVDAFNFVVGHELVHLQYGHVKLNKEKSSAAHVAHFLINVMAGVGGKKYFDEGYSTIIDDIHEADYEIEADTISLMMMDSKGHNINKAIIFIEKLIEIGPPLEQRNLQTLGWINISGFNANKKRLENAKSIVRELN